MTPTSDERRALVGPVPAGPGRTRLRLASLVGGACGLGLVVVGFGFAYAPTERAGSPPAVALALLVWPAALILAMSLAVSAMRFLLGAFDPARSRDPELIRVSQRVLANTVEQTAVFAPALLALAAVLDPSEARALAVVTALWMTGRLLFWVGYLLHPIGRAPGMAMTFAVSAAMIAVAVSRLAG